MGVIRKEGWRFKSQNYMALYWLFLEWLTQSDYNFLRYFILIPL